MRREVVLGWSVVGLLVGAAPARAQLSFDARRMGMAGVSLSRDGALGRYNPAYAAVPATLGTQCQADDPDPARPVSGAQGQHGVRLRLVVFQPDRPRELHPASADLPGDQEGPTPTNDVEFTIGQNAAARGPRLGRATRPDRPVRLRRREPSDGHRGDDQGRALRRDGVGGPRDRVPARQRAARLPAVAGFRAHQHHLRERRRRHRPGGFAPTLGYAGRIWGDSTHGIYLGAAVHYYLGVAYGSVRGSAGIVTGDTLFAGSNPVTPAIDARVQYSKAGNTFGHGVGGDVGFVYVSGPVEVGFGVNDIGATLTWSDTRVDSVHFDSAANDIASALIVNHVQHQDQAAGHATWRTPRSIWGPTRPSARWC